MGITHLQVEHFIGDVLGLGDASPRISWQYRHHPGHGPKVEIEVTRFVLGGEAHVQHAYAGVDDNVLFHWPFDPLAPREHATLRARLTDVQATGPWSDRLEVETGLLVPFLHMADFVGPSSLDGASDHRRLPLVRNEFELAERPVAARLYLTSLGLVEAEINGLRVGKDVLTPGWTCYDSRLACWTFDVTDLLHRGPNAIGLWLGDGWWRGRIGFDGGRANVYGNRLAVYAQIDAVPADGSTASMRSNSWDGSWKSAPGPIVCSDLCEGERYDARLERKGWSRPGFDDSAWQPVAEIYYDPHKIQDTPLPPVRPCERMHPRSIAKLGDRRFLVDMGQNCTQRICLHVRGLAAGERVELRHAEVLEDDGTLSTRPLRRGRQHDVYISAGVDTWWEPRFAMHGFRYAEISGIDELADDDLVVRAYHTALEETGGFECSDERVNRLCENVSWSLRSNFVSIPTDCPQRDERLGWTGDIALFAPTSCYLYDTTQFLSSWLDDVRSEQRRVGTVPYYVPYVPLGVWSDPSAIALWGDAAARVPWALYMASGDTGLLERHYDLARSWVSQVEGYLSPDAIWDRKPELMIGQLGDWLDPTAPPDDPIRAMTEKELVATAFFYESCWMTSRMAQVLDRAQDAEWLTDLANRVKRGFSERFVHADGTMTSDTQCAYALAIAFGLVKGGRRQKAGNRLAQLVHEAGYKVGTGFAGTPFVLPALTETGHVEEAYRLFLGEKCPSWLYQVSMGATTTWERWDSMLPDGTVNPGDMTSFNHYALGSVAQWVFQCVGGLAPAEPGWRSLRVAPIIGGGIDHASVWHLTPFGRAAVSWRMEDGKRVRISVDVPAGTTARIESCGIHETIASGHHELSGNLQEA